MTFAAATVIVKNMPCNYFFNGGGKGGGEGRRKGGEVLQSRGSGTGAVPSMENRLLVSLFLPTSTYICTLKKIFNVMK